MNQQMQKFEYCFPKRVYHCPCLLMFVNECFNHGEHTVADIDRHWKEYDHGNNLSCEKIFSKIVDGNMEHYIIVCETHLKTLLVAAEKITSPENTETVFVEYIDQAFCLDCVRHYLTLMYFVFTFVPF